MNLAQTMLAFLAGYLVAISKRTFADFASAAARLAELSTKRWKDLGKAAAVVALLSLLLLA